MNIAHPQEKYDEVPKLEVLEKTAKKFVEDVEKSGPKIEDGVTIGVLQTLTAYIEDKAKKDFPDVTGFFPEDVDLPSKSDNIPEYWLQFLKERALPILVAEGNPKLAKIVHVFGKMPNNETGWMPFLDKVLLPELPKPCRTVKDVFTMMENMGEQDNMMALFPIITQLMEAGGTCADAILPPEPTEDPDAAQYIEPEEPVRKCLTCDEHVAKLSMNPFSAQSCFKSCGTVLLSCKDGVDKPCFHQSNECVRCHRMNLAREDLCQEGHVSRPIVEKMNTVSKILLNTLADESELLDFQKFSEAMTGLIFNNNAIATK